jgi:hypothetical protein
MTTISPLPLSQTSVIPVDAPRKRREFLTHISDNDYLLVMDNTAAEKVIRCHTAGYYYIIQGREPHAKNAALTFGGAIHEGIEAFFKGKPEAIQDKLIRQYFLDNPAPPDEYRTVEMAVQVMKHYREQCRVRVDYHDEQVLTDKTGLIVERAFELPLGVLEIGEDIQLPTWPTPKRIDNIHVAWSGRTDRASYLASANRAVDVKTTSMGGDQFIQSFQLSTQTIGYVWADQQMWPGLGIKSFALDAIHLKRPTKSSGMLGLMEKGPRGGEPALNFFRAYFEYGQERIDDWQHNMLTIIEDFVHSLVRNYFPMSTNHCFNKYGRCPYFDVDTIDNKDIRIKMLQSDAFKDVTWDPTSGK